MLGWCKLLVLRVPAFAFPCLLIAGCGSASHHDPEVDALIEQLFEGTIEERDQAAKALIDCGDKSEARLRAMMAGANSRDRRHLSDILDRIAVPKALRGIVPPVTRVTILATNQSAREVLQDFQRQTGTPLRMNEVSRAPISVLVKDRSPLQALDAICRAADMTWHYESNGGFSMGGPKDPDEPSPPDVQLHAAPVIEFSPGRYIENPKVFIRHYQVEVVNINFHPDSEGRRRRAVVNFGLYWPAGVKPHAVEFEVTSAIDERGYQLLLRHDDPRQPPGPRRESMLAFDPHRLYQSYRLRHPDERNSKVLASVRGTARFFYFLRERVIAFDSPESSVGVVKQVDGVSAKVLDVTPFLMDGHAYLKARLLIKGLQPATPLLVRSRQRNGSSGLSTASFPKGNPEGSVVDFCLFGTQPNVVGFEVILETVCAEDVVEFEFKDVPFPR